MLKTLKKHFGYNKFRPLQKDIIQSILDKKDTFVLMPTWSWKSICYQLPALMIDWVAIVISPLIALMKDQVDGLQTNGISARFINSSLKQKEISNIKSLCQQWDIKILYITPERLSVPGFYEFLDSINLSFIAVDEAHCISEWWHDFRPDYHNLKTLKEVFPETTIIALTATATSKVQNDIKNKLNLQNPNNFLWTFDRPNLSLHVANKQDTFFKILDLLEKHKNQSVIIYCFSRKDTESISNKLIQKWYKALPYHAWLNDAERKNNQELFIKDKVDIIVATVAFGMWIDKPDVRMVIHNTFPKTLESYYQEIGRAWRDWLESECVLFYSHWDRRKHEFFINQLQDPTEQMKSRIKLQQIIDYCEINTCRRQFLLSYFEEDSEICNNCDICLKVDEMFDATEITQKILSAIIHTQNTFGATHIIDILIWSRKKAILDNFHDRLSVHGIVKDFTKPQLQQLIRSIIHHWLIIKQWDRYPTLAVSKSGLEWLNSRENISLAKPEQIRSESKTKYSKWITDFDNNLFEKLRTLRKNIANNLWLPPFMVFADTSLQEMCYYFPIDPQSFLSITWVWEQKLKKFWDIFLWEIQSYINENNINPTQKHKKTKTRTNDKTPSYTKTQKLISQKMDLTEISKSLNLKISTIINHIEILKNKWLTCDIDHIKPDKKTIIEIQQSFLKFNNDRLKPVFNELNWKYSYDTIKLVKLFLQ